MLLFLFLFLFLCLLALLLALLPYITSPLTLSLPTFCLALRGRSILRGSGSLCLLIEMGNGCGGSERCVIGRSRLYITQGRSRHRITRDCCICCRRNGRSR